MELAASIPVSRKLSLRGRSKIVLKEAFAEFLPPAIRTRAKMGFGVPIGRWFRGELREELQAILRDPVCTSRGLFPEPEMIRKLLNEHSSGAWNMRPASGHCSCSSSGSGLISIREIRVTLNVCDRPGPKSVETRSSGA